MAFTTVVRQRLNSLHCCLLMGWGGWGGAAFTHDSHTRHIFCEVRMLACQRDSNFDSPHMRREPPLEPDDDDDFPPQYECQ